MKIRRAKVEDLDALNQLHYDFTLEEAQKYDNQMIADWALSRSGKGYVKKSVEGKRNIVLVLEDRGSIQGFLFASWRKLPGRKGITLATIEMMYLTQNYRGKGIGTEMFGEFKKWSLENNAKKIATATFVKNSKAVKFYKKFGFRSRAINLEADL